jgi:hypothetical protein
VRSIFAGAPFAEGHELSARLMASVPPTQVGRMLSGAEAAELIRQLNSRRTQRNDRPAIGGNLEYGSCDWVWLRNQSLASQVAAVLPSTRLARIQPELKYNGVFPAQGQAGMWRGLAARGPRQADLPPAAPDSQRASPWGRGVRAADAASTTAGFAGRRLPPASNWRRGHDTEPFRDGDHEHGGRRWRRAGSRIFGGTDANPSIAGTPRSG